MGIQGLIPFLDKASRPANISEFSGGTAAIDAYCWLHKGVFSCAEKIVRGEVCDMYVSYCMKFINMCLAKNVKPILVFDGQKLPAKMETEEKRRELREHNRKKAAELMRMDRCKEAQTYLRRCVDITHEMALTLIRACRARNVDCIVAPYEADAQLAFLSMQNLADVIVTEDSDLLLFGAKKVLFKMDVNGNGLLIEQSKLHVAMGVKPEDFSLDKFRYMCILSGCDYLSSLSGIGLAKACRFIKRTADPDIYRALTRLSLHLNMPHLCVTQEYRDKFMEADFMFRYQPIYDPRERCLRPLTDLDPRDENHVKYRNLINMNGLNVVQLKNLAYGNLDPFKLVKVDDWSPSKKTETSNIINRKKELCKPSVAPYPSIWSENYEPSSWTKAKVEPPNALCSFMIKPHPSNECVVSSADNRRSLPIAKKNIHPNLSSVETILPRAKLSYHDGQFRKEPDVSCSIIEFTDVDSGNRVDQSRANNANFPTGISSLIDHSKKMHHNPFIKSSQSTFSVKKNIGMLDKLQQLCHSVEDDDKIDTFSGYFECNTNSASNTSLRKSATSTDHHSPPTSPIISGRPAKAKLALFQKEGVQLRSPLKMLNTSTDSNDDLDVISKTYSLPFGEENKLLRGEKEEEEEKKYEAGEIGTSRRKRTIPFVAMSADKKARAVGFLEKLNAFRRQSSSLFSRPPSNESQTMSALNISSSAAVESSFKKPETSVNPDNVLSQVSDEDEGFCSVSSCNSDLSSASSTESGLNSSPVRKLVTESNLCPHPTSRLSWRSCRTPGLKKNGPKQLLLDQYAFKSAAKMKR